MRWYQRLYDWVERRVQLEGPIKDAVLHKVPKNTASWWYVFGSAALTILIVQILTGILLAFEYTPSAANAWNSLQVLNHHVTMGWFLRAMHGWGSNFMVAIVIIHMIQVFLFGAYKFPRELTWVVGVFLLLMTLGMAFSGQVLRFDQDAYWGIGIGVSIMGRVPLVGGQLVQSVTRRSDLCWRDVNSILRSACFRHSRHSLEPCRPACLDGAEAGYQ
jgi:ubiquinol-cytochrome c reductase cytochrome b subunit